MDFTPSGLALAIAAILLISGCSAPQPNPIVTNYCGNLECSIGEDAFTCPQDCAGLPSCQLVASPDPMDPTIIEAGESFRLGIDHVNLAQPGSVEVETIVCGSGATLSGVDIYDADTLIGTCGPYTIPGQTTTIKMGFMLDANQLIGCSGMVQVPVLDVNSVPVIQIQQPDAYQVIQRNASGTADIEIKGILSGTPASIEARVAGGAWQVIQTPVVGNSFSGMLSNVPGGAHQLEVRFSDDPSVNDLLEPVGVGDLFVIAGQSNAVGQGNNQQQYSHPTQFASVYLQSDIWKEANDPTNILAPTKGSYWPLLATHFLADQNVPIGFISTAFGASGLVSPPFWPKSSHNLYSKMLLQLGEATDGSNDFKAILWHQGESDIIYAVPQEEYETALSQFMADVHQDTGTNVPLFALQVTRRTPLNPEANREKSDAIRMAISNLWLNDPFILEGPAIYDLNELSDNIHLKTDEELQTTADRWWAAVSREYYSNPDGTGARMVSVTEDTARTTITVVWQDETLPLLPAAPILGYRVVDVNGVVPISTVVQSADDTHEVTLSRALIGAAEMSYASGDDSGNITDSSPFNLPAIPFVNEPVQSP